MDLKNLLVVICKQQGSFHKVIFMKAQISKIFIEICLFERK
jgi:hypothetical protein